MWWLLMLSIIFAGFYVAFDSIRKLIKKWFSASQSEPSDSPQKE